MNPFRRCYTPTLLRHALRASGQGEKRILVQMNSAGDIDNVKVIE